MRIKINLSTLANITGETIPAISFVDLSNKTDFATDYQDISRFTIQQDFANVFVYHESTLQGETIPITECTSISSNLITREITFTYASVLIITIGANVNAILYKKIHNFYHADF